MSEAVADHTLFTDLMGGFRGLFNYTVDQTQGKIKDTVDSHLVSVRATLDLVRSENVREESLQDPQFRDRVAEEVTTSMESMQRIREAIDA